LFTIKTDNAPLSVALDGSTSQESHSTTTYFVAEKIAGIGQGREVLLKVLAGKGILDHGTNGRLQQRRIEPLATNRMCLVDNRVPRPNLEKVFQFVSHFL
jgi:hypothetical protein